MGKAMSRLGGGIGTEAPARQARERPPSYPQPHRQAQTRSRAGASGACGAAPPAQKRPSCQWSPSSATRTRARVRSSTHLTGAGIEANDRLFDTLDPTTRKKRISDTQEILLSDTVGFIRKLPHHLVSARSRRRSRSRLCRPAAARRGCFRRGLAGAGGNGRQGHRAARRARIFRASWSTTRRISATRTSSRSSGPDEGALRSRQRPGRAWTPCSPPSKRRSAGKAQGPSVHPVQRRRGARYAAPGGADRVHRLCRRGTVVEAVVDDKTCGRVSAYIIDNE